MSEQTTETISYKLSEMPIEALVRLNQDLGAKVDELREQRRVLKGLIEQRLAVQYADAKDLEIQRLKLLLIERGVRPEDLLPPGDAVAPGVVLEAAKELIAVNDFGSDVVSTGGTFTLNASTLRIQN